MSAAWLGLALECVKSVALSAASGFCKGSSFWLSSFPPTFGVRAGKSRQADLGRLIVHMKWSKIHR
jgi:hypothetical protein